MEAELALFGGRLAAADGSAMAAVGLCRRERAGLCGEKLRELAKLRFDGADFIEIDRRLAECLEKTFAEDALAVGAAVRAGGGDGLRTGGVLGSPRMAAASAGGLVERLEEDLWLYAQPGGPGFVLRGRRADAAALAALAAGEERDADWMEAELKRRGLTCALAVWDGSGAGSAGAALGVLDGTVLRYQV